MTVNYFFLFILFKTLKQCKGCEDQIYLKFAFSHTFTLTSHKQREVHWVSEMPWSIFNWNICVEVKIEVKKKKNKEKEHLKDIFRQQLVSLIKKILTLKMEKWLEFSRCKSK